MYAVMILLIEAGGIGWSGFFSRSTAPLFASTRIASRAMVSIAAAGQRGAAASTRASAAARPMAPIRKENAYIRACSLT
jgi:hypothetical protein